MLFNNCLVVLLIMFLTACAVQQAPSVTSERNDVLVEPVADYSEYAGLGLLTIEASYRDTFSKAMTALKKKRTKDAEKLLDQLIQQRPDLVSAIYNKALLLEEQSKLEASISLLQMAHAIDPSNPRVCNSLGRALRSQGKFQEAEGVYKNCLSFEDQSPIVHKNYGILLDLYLHQSELALQQYKLYMEKTGNSDKLVKGWILDLQRRIPAKEEG